MQIDINKHIEWNYPVMPMSPLDVSNTSIVCGNYNHSDMVGRFIKNIAPLIREHYNVEIIVADGGSNHSNIATIHDIMKSYWYLNISLVIVDTDALRSIIPKFHGFSFCVNAGIKVASYDKIVYCDASIVVANDFLFKMTEPLRLQQNALVRAPLLNVADADAVKTITDLNPVNEWYDKIVQMPVKRSHGRPAWAMNKSRLEELGGIDERMTRYGVCDDDLVARNIIGGGVNVITNSPVVHVFHSEARDDDDRYNGKIMDSHVADNIISVNGNKWGKWLFYINNRDFVLRRGF